MSRLESKEIFKSGHMALFLITENKLAKQFDYLRAAVIAQRSGRSGYCHSGVLLHAFQFPNQVIRLNPVIHFEIAAEPGYRTPFASMSLASFKPGRQCGFITGVAATIAPLAEKTCSLPVLFFFTTNSIQ
jgi:hypothetical protein